MLTFFDEVQRPLLPEEVDANFRDLDTRQRAVDEAGVVAVHVSDVVFDTSAGTILIALSNGASYGPYPLPVSFLVPRGDWAAGTSYHLRELVSYAGGSYVCLADHVAGASFSDDVIAGRWQVNSLKGLDGAPGAPGAPFATYIGIYDAAHAYAQGDMVLFNHPSLGFTLWRLTVASPAGTTPGAVQADGFTPTWALLTPGAPTAETEVTVYGKPTPSTVLKRVRFARPRTFPAGLAGSVAALGTATTSALTIQLLKNGVAFATVTFAANSKAGTFTAAQATSFAKGDVLLVVQSAPSSQDATASDLDLALVATIIQ